MKEGIGVVRVLTRLAGVCPELDGCPEGRPTMACEPGDPPDGPTPLLQPLDDRAKPSGDELEPGLESVPVKEPGAMGLVRIGDGDADAETIGLAGWGDLRFPL